MLQTGHRPAIMGLRILKLCICRSHSLRIRLAATLSQTVSSQIHSTHQFIQHVIEVQSTAVYTIYVSQQSSRIASIKVAQALMTNFRCRP